MDNGSPAPREVSRITCYVHHRMRRRFTERLKDLGARTVFLENGRSVRRHIKHRRFGLPGSNAQLEDSPADVFRFTVSRHNAEQVIESLIEAAELYAPGRGTIYAQDLVEYNRTGQPDLEDENLPASAGTPRPGQPRPLVNDLALLTCILSTPGSGEHLSRVALELGTCVPVVTLGIGTGLRDLLGLLRIVIPPEKEIVHLVVPVQDTTSIIRMLIENGQLNRRGRGIIYQTPARGGMLDTRLRIGRQEHAASIEQIIAAIDELKSGTTWRTRFPTLDQESIGVAPPLLRNNFEITLISEEGRSGELVSVAMDAGAGGATTVRTQRIAPLEIESGLAARERTTIIASARNCNVITRALLDSGLIARDKADRLQILPAPAAFTHGR